MSELDQRKSITNLNARASDCDLRARGFLRAKKVRLWQTSRKKLFD